MVSVLLVLTATPLANADAAAEGVAESNAESNATRARRVAALMGAFVADAAAMPLHWIYDTNQIATILRRTGRTATPEFLPKSHCEYYAYASGEFTPFGEQMEVYARALSTAQEVDPQGIADAYEAYYSSPANTTRPFVSYYDNA